MSGHSKWSNIQHRKLNQDIKKSKKFSKILKDIFNLVKYEGINSFRFKNTIITAKSMNIPKKTIEKTIHKALHKIEINNNYIIIEGKIYGISIILKCLTDNNTRTNSEIKNYFNKYGGKLCNNGELQHLFKKQYIFYIKKKYIIYSIDDLELKLIDFGAHDIIRKKEKIYIYVNFEFFGQMKNKLEKLNIKYKYKLDLVPYHTVVFTEKGHIKKFDNFVNILKNHKDITNIYSNFVKVKKVG